MDKDFLNILLALAGKPNYITGIVLDDKRIIGYRPKLNAYTGSIVGTIILCQAMYWANHASNPFYKFREPCNHDLYKPGDSWCEELGISVDEYRTAIGKISQAVTKSTLPDKTALMWRWSDRSRVTWFMVNWKRVDEVIDACYNPEKGNIHLTKKGKDTLAKGEIPLYVNDNIPFTKKGNSPTDYKEQRVPETTQSSSADSRIIMIPDDDDDFLMLRDLGVDDLQAIDVLRKFDRVLIRKKVQDVIADYNRGKIKNLTMYARKVFSQVELYPAAEQRAIIANARKAAKVSEDKKELDSCLRRNDEAEILFNSTTDTIIEHLPADELDAFKESIRNNRSVWQFYVEKGLQSIFVMAALRMWVANKYGITKGNQ